MFLKRVEKRNHLKKMNLMGSKFYADTEALLLMPLIDTSPLLL